MIPQRLRKLESDLRADDPERRAATLTELAESKHPYALELIFRRSKADDSAEALLARRGFKRSVQANIQTALRHSSLEIRHESVRLLGEARAAQAISELSRILRNDSDELMRTVSAQALSQISCVECATGLGHARLDPSLKVRQIALAGLRKLTGAAAENAIVRFLDETNWDQRVAAREHLENCGWSPVTRHHRAHWAITLGRFDEAVSQGDDSIRALVMAATQLDNDEVRTWATVALSRLRHDGVVTELRQFLRSTSRDVRVAAAATLNTLGEEATVPEIPSTPVEAAALRERRRETLFHHVVRLLALVGEA
jgi:HEAT repeat protein